MKTTRTDNRKKAFRLTEQISKPLDLYNHLPFQIAVVSNLLQLNRDASIRQLTDLEPRELRVLINIGSYSPITAADIAYQGRLDSSIVSRAVKKLLQDQLIFAEQVPSNRKARYLLLTPSGEQLYAKLARKIEQRTAQLTSVLSQDELAALNLSLAKLENKMEEILAKEALAKLATDGELAADQREIVRWYNKGT